MRKLIVLIAIYKVEKKIHKTVLIYFSITSLFIMDKSDPAKFVDHAKFLLMIFLYSGFWVLYFQMFDSVLWYVQAYVDAGSLNVAVTPKVLFLYSVIIVNGCSTSPHQGRSQKM